MFDIVMQSSTRIKTGIAMIVVLFIIGLIDSFFLTWLVLGAIMVVALYEAIQLFKIYDDKIYFYAVVVWLVAYYYPKPEDLVF